MKLLIIYFFIGFSYAFSIVVNESDPWIPCESYDFSYEINKLLNISSTKRSAAAKYCFNYDKQDSNWELLLYEQISPLSIETQKKCNVHSISGVINLAESKVFSGNSYGGLGSCFTTCIGNKKACEEREHNGCKINVNEHYNIYDYINTFYINYCFEKIMDKDKISSLFGKYLPIKWNLKISCDDEEIPILGNNYIFISEICTEEQLKKSKEYRKYEEKKE